MKTVTVKFENEEEYKNSYRRLKNTYSECWDDNAWSADLDILLELMDKVFPDLYDEDEDW